MEQTALEVGDVQRFSSIKKAISYCGLCGAEKSSANSMQRTPLSRQRNKHLQTTLIEAAKMAPRNSPELAMLYDKEKQKGNANRATLEVARKLVATSWRSTVGSAIFRWWKQTASLPKAWWVNKEDFFDA
jgi:transposase